MAILEFNAEEARSVAQHALSAAAYRDGETKPAVWLVGDQGVYLMSNGQNAGRACLVYADGINPDKDEFEDWWQRKRDTFGGDDGADTLHWCKEIIARADAGASKIRIALTKTSVELL